MVISGLLIIGCIEGYAFIKRIIMAWYKGLMRPSTSKRVPRATKRRLLAQRENQDKSNHGS